MKKILFIAMAFASMFFASCMGDGYADPDNTIKVPAAPVGDNNIKEKNVITIAQLKEDYNSLIAQRSREIRHSGTLANLVHSLVCRHREIGTRSSGAAQILEYRLSIVEIELTQTLGNPGMIVALLLGL